VDIKDDKGKVVAKVTAANPDSDSCDEGVWVEMQADDGTRPTLCFIKPKAGSVYTTGWYLGVYRDAKKPAAGCDIGLSFDEKAGPILQVVRGDDVKTVNLFDLLSK
jgi:hypothetical protein